MARKPKRSHRAYKEGKCGFISQGISFVDFQTLLFIDLRFSLLKTTCHYLLFQYDYDTEEKMNGALPFSAGEKNYSVYKI